MRATSCQSAQIGDVVVFVIGGDIGAGGSLIANIWIELRASKHETCPFHAVLKTQGHAPGKHQE